MVGPAIVTGERDDRDCADPCPDPGHQLIGDRDGLAEARVLDPVPRDLVLHALPASPAIGEIQATEKPGAQPRPVHGGRPEAERIGLRQDVLDVPIDPIRPGQAVVVEHARAFHPRRVVEEVVRAVLPEEDVRRDLVDVRVEDHVFLEGAVAARAVGEHFRVESCPEDRVVRLAVGHLDGLRERVADREDLRPSSVHPAEGPKSLVVEGDADLVGRAVAVPSRAAVRVVQRRPPPEQLVEHDRGEPAPVAAFGIPGQARWPGPERDVVRQPVVEAKRQLQRQQRDADRQQRQSELRSDAGVACRARGAVAAPVAADRSMHRSGRCLQ
ncbi:MAG: hypothetical protein M3O34_06930 [Chloroflexota bacterium]|nr:hypothetical protein [Chloroflexota bacterium]